MEQLAVSDEAPAPTPARAMSSRGGHRALALIGELMIIAGALLGLYVVWQLFYTDVQAGRQQDQVLETLPWSHVNEVTAPGASAEVLVIPDDMRMSPDTAPVMAEPAFGETFATFYVPRWGSDYVKPISEGVTRREILDRLGIGHYPRTQMPGDLGNFAISAHRTTYGKPFHNIHKLKKGDALVVETEDAWYVYRVTSDKIVSPRAVEEIAPMPGDPFAVPDDHYITLTSCHPMYSAAERYVVHGVLEYWAPQGIGIPRELVPEAAS